MELDRTCDPRYSTWSRGTINSRRSWVTDWVWGHLEALYKNKKGCRYRPVGQHLLLIFNPQHHKGKRKPTEKNSYENNHVKRFTPDISNQHDVILVWASRCRTENLEIGNFLADFDKAAWNIQWGSNNLFNDDILMPRKKEHGLPPQIIYKN